jgi:hypothetical protein
MDWSLTSFDQVALWLWCLLTGEVGKPVLGFVGLAGLFGIIRSLATLPVPKSEFITVFNKKTRYRRSTVFLGVFTMCVLVVALYCYVRSSEFLKLFGKVCELPVAVADSAITLLPLFVSLLLGLLLSAWFYWRVNVIKHSSQ